MNRFLNPFEAECILQIELEEQLKTDGSFGLNSGIGRAIAFSKKRALFLDKHLNVQGIDNERKFKVLSWWRDKLANSPVTKRRIEKILYEQITESPQRVSDLFGQAVSVRSDDGDGQVCCGDCQEKRRLQPCIIRL